MTKTSESVLFLFSLPMQACYSLSSAPTIKDGSLFIEIEKEYTGIITNANSSTSSIEGRRDN